MSYSEAYHHTPAFKGRTPVGLDLFSERADYAKESLRAHALRDTDKITSDFGLQNNPFRLPDAERMFLDYFIFQHTALTYSENPATDENSFEQFYKSLAGTTYPKMDPEGRKNLENAHKHLKDIAHLLVNAHYKKSSTNLKRDDILTLCEVNMLAYRQDTKKHGLDLELVRPQNLKDKKGLAGKRKKTFGVGLTAAILANLAVFTAVEFSQSKKNQEVSLPPVAMMRPDQSALYHLYYQQVGKTPAIESTPLPGQVTPQSINPEFYDALLIGEVKRQINLYIEEELLSKGGYNGRIDLLTFEKPLFVDEQRKKESIWRAFPDRWRGKKVKENRLVAESIVHKNPYAFLRTLDSNGKYAFWEYRLVIDRHDPASLNFETRYLGTFNEWETRGNTQNGRDVHFDVYFADPKSSTSLVDNP